MNMTGNAPQDELRERFLIGMSHAAQTVYVVTTDGAAGRAGVTVSAMTSVTADPPTVLVCVHHMSPAAAAIVENGVFCVNLLRDNQSAIADAFAGRVKTGSGDKFDCAEWKTLATGAPRVSDPLAAFDCRLIKSELSGTHHVFFGEVAAMHLAETGVPLLYARRAYGTPLRIDLKHGGREAPQEVDQLSVGCFHTFGPSLVPAVMEELFEAGHELDVRVRTGGHREIVESLRADETEIALTYDIDFGEDFEVERLSEATPHVVLPAGHPLAAQDPISIRDLADEPLILLEAAPSIRFVLEQFDALGVKPHVRFRSSSLEMVRGMVGRGLGYSILATRPASDVTYGGHALQVRRLAEEVPPSHLALVRRVGGRRSEAAEKFRGACLRYFGRPHPVDEG